MALIPIYHERGNTYEADACRPLAAAAESGEIEHAALSRGHYPGRRLAKNALPGVKTVGFWNAAHEQDWGLGWHRNEGLEITFLESGGLDFAVEERSVRLNAGDLTLTRPWQKHRVGSPRISAGRLHFLILDVGVRRPHQTWRWPPWIVLTRDDLRWLTNILRHNEQPVWHATSEIARTFHDIADAVEADRDGDGISSLAVHLNQLFLSVLKMYRRREVPLDESLSSARRTVELFWTDLQNNPEWLASEWTVRGMARCCGVGATNFTRYCKQLKNMTPMRHLSHCRLAAAAELLKSDPERGITDIALTCGFASSQYFATLFRRFFGRTPCEYRNAFRRPR